MDERPDEERRLEDGEPEVFGQEDRMRTELPVDEIPDKDRGYEERKGACRILATGDQTRTVPR